MEQDCEDIVVESDEYVIYSWMYALIDYSEYIACCEGFDVGLLCECIV